MTIYKKIKSYINHISYVNIFYKKKFIKRNITLNLLNTLNEFINIFGYSIIILLGGILIFHKTITIGIFVAMLSYYTMLTDPIARIIGNIGDIKSSFVSLKNIFEIIENKDYYSSMYFININEQNINNKLEIIDVSLSYNNKKIISNFSYTFTSGNFYKISAPSGKGKTTLLKIISLIEEEYMGKILFNRYDIKLIKNFYDIISYLPQENIIFNASIKENLTIFDVNYDEEKIKNILKIVGLFHEFENFNEFLKEKINIKDKKLSGGQIRRLCIARMLLLKPDSIIYLFDEPFAGLDEKNKELILINFKKILKNKIVIINTHDNSYNSYYDSIIRL